MADASFAVSPEGRCRRDRVTLIVALLTGLVVTAVGIQLAWSYRQEVLRRELAEASHEIEHNLSRQAGGVEALVETVAAFVESSATVTADEFESFLLRTAGLWPGLVSVEWQAWVPGRQLDAFEADMQTRRPGFRVVERDATGALVPARPRDVHLPVVHSFTTGPPPSPPGLDLASNQEWYEAKRAATETMHAVASPSFGIIGADGTGLGEGFAVNAAVLEAGTGPAHERLRGFVAAVFAYRPMIHAAVEGTRINRLRVTVRDVEDATPAYVNWPAGESGGTGISAMTETSTVHVAGRTWEIAVSPNRELFSQITLGVPWYVGGVGLCATLTGLLILTWRQRARRDREMQVVERMNVERRYRDVVDRMSGAVFVLRSRGPGSDFEIVELNAAAGQLAGCACEQAVGRPLAQIVPDAGAAGLLGALERVRARGQVERIEIAELRRGEQRGHVSAVLFPVGHDDEYCAVLHDLTELKAVESALREARDELELALEVSRVGLWSWSVSDKQLHLDPRCSRLYGLNGAEVVDNTSVAERIHPEDLKLVREETERALSEMRSFEVEYRLTLPDGTLRYLCSRARPVREHGDSVKVVGCSWDVTERRRMEEHLRRTQRLESLGTLAGGVAHDLNNALAPVTMGLDLLKRRFAGDTEAVESIKLMQTSVRRASSIVRQLIAFKRGAGDAKQQAPAHPKRILELLGSTLIESFPKEISVLIEPASLDLPRVVSDEREAHQVLLNLCVNARDAMPGGGRLVVSCQLLEVAAANQSQFPELRAGTYVAFCVSDTGSGISPEIRHRVFDPFFTTKDVGKGSGLGLSTALGIVKAHRGAIHFESREGAGTIFKVILPALPDDEPVRTVAAAPVQSTPIPATHTSCLLLVDDEIQVRELSRRALEQSGFRVITAGNGREAVELFSENVQKIDAVIMDLLMPVMNGAAATAAIKRIRPDIPIVGASGFATDALVDEARNAGMTLFLPKPFTVAILVEAVRNAMAGKRA